LDLGVGSGALLVATLRGIRSCCPGASGVGLDVSADALAIARANVVAHGLSARVRLVRGDFCDLSAVGAAGDGRDAPGGFDVLLCNPPYLTAAEAGREGEGLQGPDVALIAGDSRDTRIDPAARRGLACYEAVARGIGAAASSLIRSGGRLVVELGGKRSASGVQHLFELHAGLQVEAARKDAIGLTRCLVFKQPRACCPC
jgi:release factor glutamine methyltransferase